MRKAIEMDVTLMNTEPSFNRCIRLGTAFDKLPEGFIILFIYWAFTDVPFISGIPHHRYQVSLPHNKYLQPHYFINSCVSANSPATVLGGQDMKVAQCKSPGHEGGPVQVHYEIDNFPFKA